MNNTRQINSAIAAMVLGATAVAGYASWASHTRHGYLALAIMALAAASSRMKVKLPGIDGNMSVNLPFVLAAVLTLSAAEAVLAGFVSTIVQCWPRKNAKLNWQHMIFNLSMMSFATALAALLAHAQWPSGTTPALGATAALLAASTALFVGQTAPVAGIVALSERKPVAALWRNLAQLSFPYYVLSAGITSLLQASGSHLGWGLTLAVFPAMYAIHRSYRLYFGRMVENMQTEGLVRAAHAGV